MKTQFVLIFSFFYFYAMADVKPTKVKSTIETVTIFYNQAQIERSSKFDLKEGVNEIYLIGLSPYIQKETVRVKGVGRFTILGTSYINNFLEPIEDNQEVKTLKGKIKELNLKIKKEKLKIKILENQKNLIGDNSNFTNFDNSPTAENFKGIVDYYAEKLTAIELQLLDLELNLKEIIKKRNAFHHQLKETYSPQKTNSGVIVVKVSAKSVSSGSLDVSYLVNQVKWIPEYDIRVINTKSPISSNLKAKVKQTTGVDWENVKVRFSSVNPKVSAQIPDYSPIYLDFKNKNASFGSLESALKGKVSGVNIEYENEEVEYQIILRGRNSFSGKAESLYVIDGVISSIDEFRNLDELDIVNITVLKDESATSIYGSLAVGGVLLVETVKGSGKIPFEADFISSTVNQKETHFEYELNVPYSLQSQDKVVEIQLKEDQIVAEYEYQVLAHSLTDVFLIAKIKNWQDQNLLSGKANLYYENTFVGKTIINSENIGEYLRLSLGIDKGILVERTQDVKYNSRRVNGNSIQQTNAWNLSIQNNKNEDVDIVLVDQIPVARQKDIRVKILELDGAQHNERNGKLEWKLNLAAKNIEKKTFSYEVKYPKDKRLNNYTF